MSVDKSNGTHRGRIYVTYAAKENGNGKSVIEVRFSDNQGATWSNPSVVSITNGRQNWFPWMTVDDTNGNIYITYYSLDEATGFNTNTYVAVSNDAGQSFVNQRVSDVNHVTAPIPEFSGGYIGDYIGITAFGGVAYASWSDNRTGQWQIYVSRVSNNEITGDNSFCTTSNPYSVSNLPSGATVTWSVTPSGIVNPTPNGNQVTLNKLSDGVITLTANINNACGGTSTINTTVNVGSPSPTYINYSIDPYVGCNEVRVTTNYSAGSTYTWSYFKQPYSGNLVEFPNSSSTKKLTLTQGSGTYNIGVTATNICGTSGIYFISVPISCQTNTIKKIVPKKETLIAAIDEPSVTTDIEVASNMVKETAIYPNPANKTITVTIPQTIKPWVTATITILDGQGKAVKTIATTNTVTNIDIAALAQGSYVVKIFDGKTSTVKKLLKY